MNIKKENLEAILGYEIEEFHILPVYNGTEHISYDITVVPKKSVEYIDVDITIKPFKQNG